MRFLLVLFAVFLVFNPNPLRAAPEAKLWERWAAHDPKSAVQIDHTPWRQFLDTYLVEVGDGVNLLKYSKVTPEDKSSLERYLTYLAARPVSRLSRPQQLPYWINFYNALTVKVVLDHYPVESILKIGISPGFFSVGPWGKKLATVEGEKISLDDIEHRILRPIWQDPRIHYVLNCAAWSCPELRPLPYTAANVNAQMDDAARIYVASDRGVWFDEEGRLGTSSIYKWYAGDFGRNYKEIIAHLKKYASPKLRARLDKMRDIWVYHYDWDLNEANFKSRD